MTINNKQNNALAVARAASNSGPFCVYFFNNVKGTCFGSVR